MLPAHIFTDHTFSLMSEVIIKFKSLMNGLKFDIKTVIASHLQ